MSLPADAVVTPADPFTGWHWYNEPKKPKEAPAPACACATEGSGFQQLSPVEQAEVLKGIRKRR
jgi:conjugal transfer pilus assembly protein TraF